MGRAWYERVLYILDFGGDRRRRRGSFGVNLGRPILTNGKFDAQWCGNVCTNRAVAWSGE